MADWYRCTKCGQLKMLNAGTEKKCLACGSTDGEIVSDEQVKQGMKAGAYFSMDASGKPNKKRR